MQVKHNAEDEPDGDSSRVGGQRGGLQVPSKPTEMSINARRACSELNNKHQRKLELANAAK